MDLPTPPLFLSETGSLVAQAGLSLAEYAKDGLWVPMPPASVSQVLGL